MDDVASARSENANLRKIQQKLLQWDVKEQPLAPLSSLQLDAIETLTAGPKISSAPAAAASEATASKSGHSQIASPLYTELAGLNDGIESPQVFLNWYNRLDTEMYDRLDDVYLEYHGQLESRTRDCDVLLGQIDGAISALESLESEYTFVSNKTSSLNSASEQLIQEQTKLNEIGDEIKRRLHYFTQSEHLLQRLHSPTLSVASEMFLETLNRIDECLEYLHSNPKYKDAAAYTVKYRLCLCKAVQLIKTYVTNAFQTATQQVLESKESSKVDDKSSNTAFAIYYGKFQAFAPKVKRITSVIEERLDRSNEYEILLVDLHQSFLTQRANVMCGEVDIAVRNLTSSYRGDHCSLVRSACAFMVHVCQDEHRLFYHFFTNTSSQLGTYLEGLCTILYDSLRPYIIHINHLETLAEICSILRVEMIDEHVQHNPEPLEAFGRTANQLLQDVQERLVFRANLYLNSDILNYKPSAGDLAYPDKLEMMESIAISLQEPVFRRSDSRGSIASMVSMDVEQSHHEQQLRARTGNSPADLHGMWYPTVRRTLVCLSRLYRCVDRPIFQGLSQEALTYCIQSVSSAGQQISSRKSPIDGELFEIKHLLILREQIAPFRVDFTVKETSLDFSKVKTAAYGLLQKRKQMFAIGSNNSILEFLLDGAPAVREHLHDSRKDVDRQLKTVCERFIRDATTFLIGPVTGFIDKAQLHIRHVQTQPAQSLQGLRQMPWAAPQQISGLCQEAQRLIKNQLNHLQRSMQLYLSNRDTEFILFRPIRNNIIGAFVKLEQLLTTNAYNSDDLIIASCPSADQISVLLSASVLTDANDCGSSERSSRKVSTSSMEGDGGTSARPSLAGLRKVSMEKKVSFDTPPIFESAEHQGASPAPSDLETQTTLTSAASIPENDVAKKNQIIENDDDSGDVIAAEDSIISKPTV